MEKINRNVIIGKAGGTAGKSSVNYKISLPADWVKQIGITPYDKSVIMEFDGWQIIIKKEGSK
ncbi:MAG: hypothetical protein Q4A75_01420 [Peptostreptococcaceae bacterium]|nr:hypothetical protein [Peptostreptococcaceae bacterium]